MTKNLLYAITAFIFSNMILCANSINDNIKTYGNTIITNDSVSLFYDSFFLDEVLSNYALSYDIPEEFDKNVVSLLWGSGRSTTVFFDGIPLNSTLYGDFDFLRIPYNLSQVIRVNTTFPNSKQSSYNNSGYITLQSNKEYKAMKKINVQGGNAHGSSHFSLFGGKSNFFWNVSGNFYTSNGHTISSDKPDSISILRENSKARHYSMFAKAGIKDDNSLLMLSVFFSDISRDIPLNIYYDSLRAQEIGGGLSLVNLEFVTILNSFVSIEGNIYFKGSTRDINGSFSNVSFANTNFSSKEDEQSLGANVHTKMRIIDGVRTNLNVGYRREVTAMTTLRNSLEEYGRITAETLNAKFEIGSKLSELFEINSALEYMIFHPVSTNEIELLNDLSSINAYLQLVTHLSRNITWANFAKIGGQLPPLVLMSEKFSSVPFQSDPMIESVTQFSSSLNWQFSELANVAISYNYVDASDVSYVGYSDTALVVLRDGEYKVHGVGVDLRANLYNFDFILRGDYKLNNNGSISLFNRPHSQLFCQISHAFDFGFEWNLEAKYQGATQDYDSIEQLLIDLDEFTVFNIRVSQQVFKQNEIFLRINNITDDFRLKSWGNPIKGRNFIAGINLHF
ncbi:MAG: hypothetical protein CVV22_01550 [Ignavibacteriae bacterium HGW-Ignavibacteriae-1]|jgi:hypothetical protein|nr:MAG: hypothetical protein CVV22_01550 [Ignavibacteriae bacterium HGW-Ignavibacteriae-1]